MTKRIALLSTLILSLVLLPGCPGTPSAGLGVWIILIDGIPNSIGAELTANGDVLPALGLSFMGGTVTWEQITDSEILIRQVVVNDLTVYYATLDSDTMMSGGWVKVDGIGEGGGGAWSATKQ